MCVVFGYNGGEEVADERAAMFEDAFSKLTDEEKQTLSDLLDKLLAD